MSELAMPNNYYHNWGDDGANWVRRQPYLLGENLTMQELRTLRAVRGGAATIKEVSSALGLRSTGSTNDKVMKLWHRGLLICEGRTKAGFSFAISDEGERRVEALSHH